ncbi:hypothetical protein GCM10008986_27430 [Salinibacillus aidingensis]|uniref:Uncharacterized protein n=1 Tax=Salinibacillus aidingensis TaxID=237684 RepID=A0ABN1BIV7_9BACI
MEISLYKMFKDNGSIKFKVESEVHDGVRSTPRGTGYFKRFWRSDYPTTSCSVGIPDSSGDTSDS